MTKWTFLYQYISILFLDFNCYSLWEFSYHFSISFHISLWPAYGRVNGVKTCFTFSFWGIILLAFCLYLVMIQGWSMIFFKYLLCLCIQLSSFPCRSKSHLSFRSPFLGILAVSHLNFTLINIKAFIKNYPWARKHAAIDVVDWFYAFCHRKQIDAFSNVNEVYLFLTLLHI